MTCTRNSNYRYNLRYRGNPERKSAESLPLGNGIEGNLNKGSNVTTIALGKNAVKHAMKESQYI